MYHQVQPYIRSWENRPDHKVVLLSNEATIREYRNMLRNTHEQNQAIIHQIDTSFDFNGEFLTCVSYRHPYIAREETVNAGNPVPKTIPLFTYIHTRRTEEEHDHAFHKMNRLLERKVPEFAQRNKVMISDREFQGPFFPNTTPVNCWNHMARNLEFHARDRQKMPVEHRRALNNNLYALLKSSSEENYEQRLERFFQQPQWTPEMQRYFYRHLDQDIRTKSSAFFLESIGVENPTEGVTNNASESLNNVFRKLRSKTHPRPKANLVFGLKVIEDGIDMEVIRAYHNQGSLRLTDDYRKALQRPGNQMPAMNYKTEKQYLAELAQVVGKAQKEENLVNTSTQLHLTDDPAMPTISLVAKDFIDRNAVGETTIEGRKVYSAMARDETIYNVSVDTKNPRCSCGSRTVCPHMIAVRFSIGMQTDFDVPPEFKKAYEKSLPKVPKRGTKKPKRGDTKVQSTEHVTMKTTKTIVTMNDPSMAPIEEEQEEQQLAEEENVAQHSPAHSDDLFPNIPDFSKGLPAQQVLEVLDKQLLQNEQAMRSASDTQEAFDNVLEDYNLKNLERPPEMEGLELSEVGSVKSGEQIFYVGTAPPTLADDDDEYQEFIYDEVKTAFDPNTIEEFPPKTNDSVQEDLETTNKTTNPPAEITERAELPKDQALDFKEKQHEQTELQSQPTRPDAVDKFIESALGIKITPKDIKPEDQKTPKKRQLSPTKSDPSWTPKRHQRSPIKATDVVDPEQRITRSASESTIKPPQPERTKSEDAQAETKLTEERDGMTHSPATQTKVVAENIVPTVVQQPEATEKEDEKVKASVAPVTKVLIQPTLSSMLKGKTEPHKLSKEELRQKFEENYSGELAALEAERVRRMGGKEGFIGDVDIDDPLSQRDVRLLENQYRVFVKNTDDGVKDVMAVKRINNKAYAFFPQKDHATKENIALAAYSVAACSRKVSDRSNVVTSEKVTVCTVKTNNLRKAAEEANKTTMAKVTGKQVPLSDCYCSKPMTEDDNRVNCRTCGKKFHLSCAGMPTHPRTWSCDQHKVRLKGADWAAGVQNTCPIDNHITMFSELAARNPKFLDYFNTGSHNDKALRETIELAMKERYAEAQLRWAKHRGKTNFYSSPGEELITRMDCLENFHRMAVCDNPKCPKPVTFEEVQKEIMLEADNPNEDLNALVTGTIYKKCPNKTCEDGILTVGPMEPKVPELPPPMFVLDNLREKANFESLTTLPAEVKLGDHIYEQKMIVMNDPGNHFYSFMNFDGHWLHYDGIDRRGTRFEPVRPRHYLNNTLTNSCVYTLKLPNRTV
jgi:hypothetical protein